MLQQTRASYSLHSTHLQYATDKLTPQYHDELRKKLHKAGVQAVFKENLVTQILKESAENIAKVQKKGIEDQLRSFIDKLHESFVVKAKKKMTEQQAKWVTMLYDKERRDRLLAKGYQLVQAAQVSSVESTAGKTFDARLARLVMTNFMGVQVRTTLSHRNRNPPLNASLVAH